jgi:hypothetical protein
VRNPDLLENRFAASRLGDPRNRDQENQAEN